LVSAEHGGGIIDLVEVIAERLPDVAAVPKPDAPAVAIVGRPNVGKSSLLNRIAGEERALVSPIAGTTRDPLDTLVEHEGQSWLLVDTAGIRRRAKVTGDPEAIAVMLARRQIERAEVVILVIDASAGVTSGDLTIAGVIWELGRSAVVAINKWDLLDDEKREELEDSMERLDQLLANPPRVNLSALTGRGVGKLFAAVAKGLEGARWRISTGELNRVLEAATKAHHAPSLAGRPWKFFYATQVGAGPPTFMLFSNRLLSRNDAYRRYLENRLREAFELPGTPIRLVVRRRGSTMAPAST
jgi:GTP-binding protein